MPEPVQRVLLKALAKNRLDRYETVEEMIAAFKASWAEAGIPMQGTAITSAGNRSQRKVSQKPKARWKAAKTVAVQSAAPKRSSSWMWIGVGLVTILCIGVAVFAVWRNRPAFRTQPTSVAATVVAATPLTPLPATNAPIPAIHLAKYFSRGFSCNRVSDDINPGDPNAHLALSLALWMQVKLPPRFRNWRRLPNLARYNSAEFFMRAAGLKPVKAWVPAAGMYMRLVPMACDCQYAG